MSNNSFSNDDGNLLLSYELLYLLQWLVDHEEEALKKLIAKSMRHGYRSSNPTNSAHDYIELHVSDPAIQHSIVEFLSLMDTLLFETYNEHNVDNVLVRSTIPALNQIDNSICDKDTVDTSLDKMQQQMQKEPESNAQEVLLKELLKRWKPAKKMMN